MKFGIKSILFLFITFNYIEINVLAMGEVNLKDHALPAENPMRGKLDHIFTIDKNLNDLKNHGSFEAFSSFHWIVGKFKSLPQFIVKAAIPGKREFKSDEIRNYAIVSQTEKLYSAYQNKEWIRKQKAIPIIENMPLDTIIKVAGEISARNTGDPLMNSLITEEHMDKAYKFLGELTADPKTEKCRDAEEKFRNAFVNIVTEFNYSKYNNKSRLREDLEKSHNNFKMKDVVKYGPTQNISRIAMSEKINKILNQKGISKIKAVKCWAYPISGNNKDLENKDINDEQVVIIEEKVDNIADSVLDPLATNKMVSAISDKHFEAFETIIGETAFADLHKDNIALDPSTGEITLFDTEDLFNEKYKTLEKAWFFPKFRKWLVEHEAKAEGFGKLALLAIESKKPKLILKYQLNSTKHTLLAHSPRLATELTILSIIIRHFYYVRKVKNLINNSRIEIKKVLLDSNTINEYICLETSKKVLGKTNHSENREEIFKAFATIALAEIKQEQTELDSDGSNPIKIFDKEYDSFEDAIKESVEFIDSTWRSDWSLRSKMVSLFKRISNKLINLFSNKTQSSISLAGEA